VITAALNTSATHHISTQATVWPTGLQEAA